MTAYLVRRSVEGFFVLAVASFLIYSILMLAPGGPLSQLIFGCPRCPPLTEEAKCNLLRTYGLDKPWPISYLVWLFDPRDTTRIDESYNTVSKGIDIKIPAFYIGDWRIGPSRESAPPPTTGCDRFFPPAPEQIKYDGWQIRGSGVLTGDFGNATVVSKGTPVTYLMGSRIGQTLLLMVTALLVSLLIAFPLGIISALKQYSRLDYTVTAFSFVGLSMPSFWLSLMLIIFFAVLPRQWHDNAGLSWMPYLPTGDISDIGKDDDILNRIYHLILPVAVLAFIQIAGWSRFIRASMLEVMRQDYVRTAWAKGLGFRPIILKHALRNALVPIITILGLALPGLVQGAIITEAVFAYAGMGRLYLEAVTQLDIPLAMAFLMIVTALVVASNMLADMLYAVVDPRIRFS